MERGKKPGWRRLLLPLAVLALSLLGGMGVLAAETVEVHYGGRLDYDKGNQIVQLINQQRTANGRTTLKQTGDLQNMAMIRAMEIALYYDHTRPNGTRGLDIMGSGGTRAENIAVGNGTVSQVVNSWMNSSGHRANILNANVTQTGVGCFYANNTWWWVQLFRSGSGGSGTVQSGAADKAIAVDVLTSYLQPYLIKSGTSFSTSQTISATAGEIQSVLAVNLNQGASGSNRILTLYADSPGLSWASDGSFSVTTTASSTGAYLSGISCGSHRLTLRYGSRSATATVTAEHLRESGTNCTKDIKCTVCGAVLEKKSGHTAALCEEYTTCRKCGVSLAPTGHKWDHGPQCGKVSTCETCGERVSYGHDFTVQDCMHQRICRRCGKNEGYGTHKWGAWKNSGNYRIRTCSVCGKTDKVQTSYGFTWDLPSWAENGSSSGSSGSSSSSSGSSSVSKAKVKSVKITGKTSVLTGKKITLKASVSPSNAANKSVSWSVSNKKYATISSKGVLTAKSAGAGKTVTVTAKAKDGSGKKATFKVKIKGAVTKITLKGSKTLSPGKKTTIKATVKTGKGGSKALSWSVSNKKYASISSKGVLTAKSAGAGKTVTVTAKAKDGSGKKATFKVKIKGGVTKITLKGARTLKAGRRTTVKATVKASKGVSKALTWSVSNKKYATVSSKGVVKARKAGKGKTVTVTAKAKDGSGKKASIRIQIK